MNIMPHYFERKASQYITFGWDHGRFADFWSFVHILTGIALGAMASLLHLQAFHALIIITIIAVFYEVLEITSGVAEDIENSLTDIVLAALGASLTLYGFALFSSSQSIRALVLISTLAVNLFLIHRGWQHYLKKRARTERSHRYLLMGLQGLTILIAAVIIWAILFWLL